MEVWKIAIAVAAAVLYLWGAGVTAGRLTRYNISTGLRWTPIGAPPWHAPQIYAGAMVWPAVALWSFVVLPPSRAVGRAASSVVKSGFGVGRAETVPVRLTAQGAKLLAASEMAEDARREADWVRNKPTGRNIG
jgi:hypothetical protein